MLWILHTSLHGKFKMSCRKCAKQCSASQVGTTTASLSQQPQSEEPISISQATLSRADMSAHWLTSYEWINYSEKPPFLENRHPLWRNACTYAAGSCEEAGRGARNSRQTLSRRRAGSPLQRGVEDLGITGFYQAMNGPHPNGLDFLGGGFCCENCDEFFEESGV